MILPWTKPRTFVEAITIFFIFFTKNWTFNAFHITSQNVSGRIMRPPSDGGLKTYVIFDLKELLDPINVHYSCFLNFTENAKFLSSISKRGNKSVISSLGDPKHFFWSQMKPKLKHTIDIEQSVLIVERDNIFKEQWMCSLQLGLIFQESKDKYICNLFF